MKIGENIELKWLGHASFMLRNLKDRKIIYIDPYNLKENVSEEDKADIILITHSHYDHCSIADINKIVKDGTAIVLTADSQSKITRLNFKVKIQIIEPGREISLGNIKV